MSQKPAPNGWENFLRSMFKPKETVWLEVDSMPVPELKAPPACESHDLYREMAAELLRKAPDEVTPEDRYLAKQVVFGRFYGNKPSPPNPDLQVPDPVCAYHFKSTVKSGRFQCHEPNQAALPTRNLNEYPPLEYEVSVLGQFDIPPPMPPSVYDAADWEEWEDKRQVISQILSQVLSVCPFVK